MGGSDTIATTMRWILVCLVENPDAQQKSREEIQSALRMGFKMMLPIQWRILKTISKSDFSQGKSIDTENCPYFSAVLLEAQRFYPAGETIMHRTSEDIEFKGTNHDQETRLFTCILIL